MKSDPGPILFFVHTLPAGGLPRIMAQEIIHLRTMGAKVTCSALSRSDAPYLDALIQELGINGHLDVRRHSVSAHRREATLERLRVSDYPLRLTDVLRTFACYVRATPSVAICHELKAAVLSLPFLFLFRVKLITVLHDNPLAFARCNTDVRGLKDRLIIAIGKLLGLIALRFSKVVVATSQKIADDLRNAASFRNIRVIPLGIELSQRRRAWSDREGLLTVATWGPDRNPEWYLDLAEKLSEDVQFTFVGHWKDQASRDRFLFNRRSRRLEQRIRVLEDVSDEDLRELYDTSLAFVRFGFDEHGTGQGVTEALGSGCPVTINESLGASAIVVNHVHGLVFKDGATPSAVAEGMMGLIGDKASWAQMSDACVNLARHFSWAAHSEGLYRLIVQS